MRAMLLAVVAIAALAPSPEPAQPARAIASHVHAEPACVPPDPTPPDAAPGGTLYSDGSPPRRFRKPTGTMLQTMNPRDLERFCDDGPPTCGYVTEACTTEIEGRNERGKRVSAPLVTMPNPCDFPESDAYAHLLCHELGHVNGWPESHGR